jgi:hypothetical protein
VTKFLCADESVLPRHLVERRRIEDVEVCRLTAPGVSHLHSFFGLYAALYPGARKPLRLEAALRYTSKNRAPHSVETFSLPNRPERLVMPQPSLELLRSPATSANAFLSVDLSPQFRLALGPNHIWAVTTVAPMEFDRPHGPLDFDEPTGE